MNNISNTVLKSRIEKINFYKNEVLAAMSHNLKTPLNGMMLFA